MLFTADVSAVYDIILGLCKKKDGNSTNIGIKMGHIIHQGNENTSI